MNLRAPPLRTEYAYGERAGAAFGVGREGTSVPEDEERVLIEMIPVYRRHSAGIREIA